MIEENTISAQIIGQIALMQSVITQLPDIKSVMEFVCQGFKDLPGVKKTHCSRDDSLILETDGNEKYYKFLIKHKDICYGSINLLVEDLNLVKPYFPYIENLSRIIAIIFEEQKHRKLNEELLSNLEIKVLERTRALEEQIKQRIFVEESLRQSEKKLSFALTASNSGIWDWNIIENKIVFDDNYYIISGYTPGEFPSNYDEWRKRVHPRDITYVEKLINDYLRGDIKRFNTEFRFKCKNNKWMWVLGQGEIYSYKDGQPERFIGTHIDIDYQKRVEKKLERATEYISNIIDSMPSIIVGINKNQIITQWNREAIDLTNIKQTDAVGKKLLDILPYLSPYISKSLESFEIFNEQTTFKLEHLKNDNIVYERITTYPLTSQGMKGAVIRIDDITELQKLQEKLNQSQKMDSIGQLAGGIAHDFNNILSGIIGAAQLLESPKRGVSKENLKYVDLIIKSSTKAGDLTSKLLHFGRKGSIISANLNIIDIIEDVIALLNRTINKNIQINFNNRSNWQSVIGDSSAIQSVIMNICINASHAMPDGGKLLIESRNIFLDLDYCHSSTFDLTPGNYIEIIITDNGIGIKKENLEVIFEPFFTTKNIGEGTGLGLSAAYGTIIEHKGAITVYSELNVGTVFYIYLPCNKTLINSVKQIDEQHIGKGHVLLIDDEKSIRFTTKHILEDMGYVVTVAEDGAKGLEYFKIKHKEINLVLMDMIMPQMNGREAFYKMKEIDPNCKIVITSGFPKDEDINELKHSGVSGFIKKPFKKSELSKLFNEIFLK